VKRLLRIVLSNLLSNWAGLLAAVIMSSSACSGDMYPGIGTSPSFDDDPVAQTSAPLDSCPPLPCGLWTSGARHAARPDAPDLQQYARPGGLSCASLLARALPGEVVYYVAP